MGAITYGIQLFTLRKYLQDEKNIPKVFNFCKSLGAETVQVSGMCAIDAEELNSIAKDNGLSICCTHSPFDRIVNDIDKLAEEHLVYGSKIIGIGMMPGQYRAGGDKLNQFIDILNTSAEKLKSYGMKIAYHNHAFEFKKDGNELIYDKLIAGTDKAVDFIVDTYWLRYAGMDIEGYLEKLKGRVSVLHLKDYKKILFLPIMCELGRGKLDFKIILAQAEKTGVKYAVIEQDISANPYKSLEISMDYLKKKIIE